MEKEFSKTSITLEKNEYKLFKQICKLKNTDSSKEIRRFIEEYNLKNKVVYSKNEKNNIKILISLTSEDDNNYKIIREKIDNVIKKYNINLEIEKIVNDINKSNIGYFSKATGSEYISEIYLKFLSDFIDVLNKLEKEYNITHYSLD